MTETKHTPTPWKVVSTPNFDSGLVYTSIQPVTVDEEAMKPLAMANGEYHVCRMSHSAAPWRFDYHRADAAFIVEAVNSYAALQAEVERLREALTTSRNALEPFSLSNEAIKTFDPDFPLEGAALRASFDVYSRFLGRDNSEELKRSAVTRADIQRAAEAFDVARAAIGGSGNG